MGLFDSYFDPEQFQDSGGLLGRLLSLQSMQGQYQPGDGFDPRASATGQTPSTTQMPTSVSPPQSAASALGATRAGPQTPDYGQTQNIAIGDYRMPQFGRADISQTAVQSPDLGDRLSAGFQSWAHTPVGNPFAALANGVAGLSAGQRVDTAGNPQQDLNLQYQALRPILGDHHAMLAIVHPEVGRTMIARALADRAKTGNVGSAAPPADG